MWRGMHQDEVRWRILVHAALNESSIWASWSSCICRCGFDDFLVCDCLRYQYWACFIMMPLSWFRTRVFDHPRQRHYVGRCLKKRRMIGCNLNSIALAWRINIGRTIVAAQQARLNSSESSFINDSHWCRFIQAVAHAISFLVPRALAAILGVARASYHILSPSFHLIVASLLMMILSSMHTWFWTLGGLLWLVRMLIELLLLRLIFLFVLFRWSWMTLKHLAKSKCLKTSYIQAVMTVLCWCADSIKSSPSPLFLFSECSICSGNLK